MSKQDLKKAAANLFKIHPTIEKLYMTSDKQGFTKEHHAYDHSKKLADKKVYPFTPADLLESPDKKKGSKTETKANETKGDRETLVEKYELLFGEKPAHNISVKKLKTRIAEKEAAISNAPVDTGGVDTDAEKSTEDKKEDKTASEAADLMNQNNI